MAKRRRQQIVKSLVLTALGAAPGVIWFVNAGTTQSVVIACLGTFIGFALSLPGVSTTRVLRGTAGAIVAKNAPRRVRRQVFDAFLGEDEPPEEPHDRIQHRTDEPEEPN